ncbi:uncharacterized protein [Lepeophtheirus salmonis]|uniref:uncharacterized protein n=1 Tax=Lepeophtheirus salmonis TaxID=72036 RepID=UPI001AE3E842|nr:uncharacterized protein LOC121126076 [Lepeophtheirus salmonis]
MSSMDLENEIKERFQIFSEQFPLHIETPVEISWVETPNKFWIRHPGADQVLALITAKYSRSMGKLIVGQPRIHTNGIYLYMKNDHIYRMKLISPNEGQLMDTGESHVSIKNSELHACPSFLRELRPIAFQSSLANVELSNGSWKSDLYRSLRSFLCSLKVELRVQVVQENKYTLQVFLFDKTGPIFDMFKNTNQNEIICHITKKEIFAGDINFEELKMHVQHFGKVINLKTGLSFNFVLNSELSKYERGIVQIQEIYNKRLKIPIRNPPSTEFQIVVAKLKSIWARCMITKEYESGYALYNIDTGEEEDGIREVYELYEDMASLPCFLHECELFGYDKYNKDDLFIGRSLIVHEKIVDICVKRRHGTTNIVDIYV